MLDELRLAAEDRDNLVAYLDQELPAEDRERLEVKLSRSLSGRREVEALEKTWELLDFLPRPKVPEDFTNRTLDRIQSQDLQQELRIQKASEVIRWTGTLVAWAVGIAACLGLGLMITRFLVP